jgi:hypothetical protein
MEQSAVATILLPLALFLSVISSDATEPNPQVSLAYVGAISLAVGLLLLGVALVRGGQSFRDGDEPRDG